jgi:hypothetical protein
MKKGTCESGKMGRRPVAFESAQGSAIDRRRGRQGGSGDAWRVRGRGPGSDRWGTARVVQQQPAAARLWCAWAAQRVCTVGWCRVAGEWGPVGSRSGRAERGVWRVG